MVENIDPELPHHSHRHGMNAGGLGSGGKSLYPPSQIMIYQSLGHLAASAIMGTDKKNPLHEWCILAKISQIPSGEKAALLHNR
jgi:hypothetical protein